MDFLYKYGFYLLICLYFAFWIIELLVCFIISQIRVHKKSFEESDLKVISKPKKKKNIIKEVLFSLINGIEKRTIFRISKIPSHWFRMFCYKYIFGMKTGQNVVIYSGTIFRKMSFISVAQGTVIGDRCELDGRGGLVIGKNCNLSSEVHIWSAQHSVQSSNFEYTTQKVEIGDYCWISSNTIILPGVKMGDGSVLAAGAVLTKDTEPYGVYAGIPAKKIGERNKELTYDFDGSHDWFM